MKNIFSLIIILIIANISFAQTQNDTLIDCAKIANKKGKMVYLKSFTTNLDSKKVKEKWPLILNSGVKYRFFLCENTTEKPENLELILFDKKHPEKAPYVITNKKGLFNFECNKTGNYFLLVRFKKEATKTPIKAVAVLFFVKKNK